jgi:hypothetical protein
VPQPISGRRGDKGRHPSPPSKTRERETRKLPPFAPIRGYAQIATGISSPSTSGGEENETASPLTSRLATTSAASASTQSSRPTSLGKGMSITCGAVPASQPECAALLRPPTVTGQRIDNLALVLAVKLRATTTRTNCCPRRHASVEAPQLASHTL